MGFRTLQFPSCGTAYVQTGHPEEARPPLIVGPLESSVRLFSFLSCLAEKLDGDHDGTGATRRLPPSRKTDSGRFQLRKLNGIAYCTPFCPCKRKRPPLWGGVLFYPIRLSSRPPAITEAICPETLAPAACISKKFSGIFFEPHLVNHPAGHGKRGNPRGADHGYSLLLFGKQIHELSAKQHAAEGVEDKRDQAKAQNHQRFLGDKILRLHFRGDGDSQQQGN